jgi:hypothetical protein
MADHGGGSLMASPKSRGRPPGVDAKSPEWIGYRDHRNSARQRQIRFALTFEQWLSIWSASGKFNLRGRKSGCFVMARFNDQGDYEIGNVEIVSHEANSSAPHFGRTPDHQQTPSWRAQHSKTMKRLASNPGRKAMLQEAGRKGAAARWGI